MLLGPLPARPSDWTLARAKARGCIEGQREQRFHFALVKFLFLQPYDSTFPTSIVYSRKVNDTTSSVWHGDSGGSERPQGCGSRGFALATSQGGLSPSAGQKTSPVVSVRCGRLLCGAAALHPRGNRVGSISPDFLCTAVASKACLVRGLPLLFAGKLLAAIHRVGWRNSRGVSALAVPQWGVI